MSKSGGNLIFNEEEFENNVELSDINIDLSDKMEELKKTNLTKDNGDNMEVKYHGIVIPVKNEKIKSHFLKIDEVNSRIEKESDLNKKLIIFSEVFNNIDEIIKLVKKNKLEETPNQSDSNLY
jgi:hypothetical protein